MDDIGKQPPKKKKGKGTPKRRKKKKGKRTTTISSQHSWLAFIITERGREIKGGSSNSEK